jgi:phosphoserine phosphatase
VPGESQTDIVSNDVDKARGLSALAELLGIPGAPIALAVGDAVEDLPMLRVANLALAPANADAAVAASEVRVGRHSYQSGLAEAVAELIGHSPGGCRACAAEPRSRRGSVAPATHHSSIARSMALPPTAAVLTVSVCSVAKRGR